MYLNYFTDPANAIAVTGLKQITKAALHAFGVRVALSAHHRDRPGARGAQSHLRPVALAVLFGGSWALMALWCCEHRRPVFNICAKRFGEKSRFGSRVCRGPAWFSRIAKRRVVLAIHRIKAILSAPLVLLALAAHVQAAAEPSVPSVEEFMQYLGYADEHKNAFLAEKIVATDIKRTRDDQLVALVAVYLPVKIDQLATNLRQGLNIKRDPDVMAFGELREGGGSEQFDRITFAADEKAEVRRLLRVKASNTFNLSSQEIEQLRNKLKGTSADDPAAIEAVSAAYREVLEGRFRAYLGKGLKGIQTYDRGNGMRSPADQLSADYSKAKLFLSEHFPAFNKALTGYPKDQAPDISNQIYWIKRNVEGRPAFVLAHQLVDAGPNHVLLSQRQFFVGHTYESLQVIALALPFRDGAAIFYGNAAFTDKITGFFSGVAHSVGQSRMKEDLTKYFKAVREKNIQ